MTFHKCLKSAAFTLQVSETNSNLLRIKGRLRVSSKRPLDGAMYINISFSGGPTKRF